MSEFFAGAGPLVLGHRGYARHLPENTLGAFRAALAAGADGVECDVRLSADGEPVILHDADLARVSAGSSSAKLDELTLGDLEQIVLSGGEKVPTLASVLDWATETGALLNLELKGDDRPEPLLQAVAARLEHARIPAGRVVLSCFELEVALRIRQELPAYAVGLLTVGLTDSVETWLDVNADSRSVWLVHPQLHAVDLETLQHWRSLGARLGIWGANTAREIAKLTALVRSGLKPELAISDEPGLLRESLGV